VSDVGDDQRQRQEDEEEDEEAAAADPEQLVGRATLPKATAQHTQALKNKHLVSFKFAIEKRIFILLLGLTTNLLLLF
jgi:hypothetical protein